MPLGPIEIVTIGFPQNRLTGTLVPEIQKLVDAETVTIVDGLFVSKDTDGHTTLTELAELAELDANDDAAGLVATMDRVDGLISDEDVEAFTSTLEPNSSAAILAFEHTWMKPLRDAVLDAGGVLLDTVRIPGRVVEEVLATVPDDA